jgi:carbonic anhydrase
LKKPVITSKEALALLKEGNARYVCGRFESPNRGKTRRTGTLEQGQSPFATVVGCSDSRVPVEIIFDRGIGDLFVIRVAGNLVGPSELGSIEYAVAHLGTPIVLLLGHTNCGAVTAVVQNAEIEENILPLVERMVHAVERARQAHPEAEGDPLVTAAVKENIWHQIESLFRSSEVVRSAVRNGTVEVVGAMYDLEHGDMLWMGNHPEQAQLIG